jgi:hypothetical protein
VAVDQTEPEAMIADRSRALAQTLDGAARAQGLILWLYFDHPAVVFSDEPRWALTAFIKQALRAENLRVALAGYEALQMPAVRFQETSQAQGDGAAGLLVEYLTDVGDVDVRNLIDKAAKEMGREISPERVKEWTAEALQGLDRVNGRYESAHRVVIAARLQPRLRQLRDEGGEP